MMRSSCSVRSRSGSRARSSCSAGRKWPYTIQHDPMSRSGTIQHDPMKPPHTIQHDPMKTSGCSWGSGGSRVFGSPSKRYKLPRSKFHCSREEVKDEARCARIALTTTLGRRGKERLVPAFPDPAAPTSQSVPQPSVFNPSAAQSDPVLPSPETGVQRAMFPATESVCVVSGGKDKMAERFPKVTKARKRSTLEQLAVERPTLEELLVIERCYRDDRLIHKALHHIDEARQDLILKQNVLGRILRKAHPFMRKQFAAFYTAGGVTADDWYYHRDRLLAGEPKQPIKHGPVRLVRQRRRIGGGPPGGGRIVDEEDWEDGGPWQAA
jgi:hypothetical protein